MNEKRDIETIANDWWSGDLQKERFIDSLTPPDYRTVQAEVSEAIRQHEIRLNRLGILRDEMRERVLRRMGVAQ